MDRAARLDEKEVGGKVASRGGGKRGTYAPEPRRDDDGAEHGDEWHLLPQCGIQRPAQSHRGQDGRKGDDPAQFSPAEKRGNLRPPPVKKLSPSRLQGHRASSRLGESAHAELPAHRSTWAWWRVGRPARHKRRPPDPSP